MAAPGIAALAASFPRGPGQTPDNLTGLPNVNVRGLGVQGAGTIGGSATQYYDCKVGSIWIKTGAAVPGSPNGTGSAKIFVVGSEDGTHWPDGLDPNSTDGSTTTGQGKLFISSQSVGSHLVQQIACPASATVYQFDSFSVYLKLGWMPTFWGIFISNNTGAAFDATAANFIALHTLVTFP